MKYEFPVINHIDDVLPHIEHDNSFVVARKDTYTAIDYVVVTSDSFRPLGIDRNSDIRSKIRRECRGLIFDTNGKIIRRPFHKFFNYMEREETLTANLPVDQGFDVITKLDGSMIAPFITLDGVLRWGTKLGETTVAEPVKHWINWNTKGARYNEFAIEMIQHGWTPIFEWMSRENRIIIDYGVEPKLVLTGIRYMRTGMYMERHRMSVVAEQYGVPLVEYNDFNGWDSFDHMFQSFSNEVDCEGYVIRFNDGHMVKLKTTQYVTLHKAKDSILREHNVATLVLDGKVDDILPHLLQTDADRLRTYQDALIKWMTTAFIDYRDRSFQLIVTDKIAIKDFALQHAKSFGPFAAIVYRMARDLEIHEPNSWNHRFIEECRALLLKNANSQSGWVLFKKTNGLTLEWNDL